MASSIKLGKYEYSDWTVKLAATLFVVGFVYSVLTRKGFWGVLAISFLGSAVGYSIGALVKAPKRIEE